MDQEEIRELEPKYTGNQRHLTEGEAAAIKNDPANQADEDDDPFNRIINLALTGMNDE
ncbi:hypothetical protein [Paenibacillus thalictri]|uniref:hypothetical protein n=1 Tax=Paenibacillus thalictri TaxID=2527873 RepID=UPI0013EF3FF7|nr:hypothetical protein [Paenibacillus thalictri]